MLQSVELSNAAPHLLKVGGRVFLWRMAGRRIASSLIEKLLFCVCSLFAPHPTIPSPPHPFTPHLLTVSVSVAQTYPPHKRTHVLTLARCLCHTAHLVSLLGLPQRSSAGPQDVKGRLKPVGAAASCRDASESSPLHHHSTAPRHPIRPFL